MYYFSTISCVDAIPGYCRFIGTQAGTNLLFPSSIRRFLRSRAVAGLAVSVGPERSAGTRARPSSAGRALRERGTKGDDEEGVLSIPVALGNAMLVKSRTCWRRGTALSSRRRGEKTHAERRSRRIARFKGTDEEGAAPERNPRETDRERTIGSAGTTVLGRWHE